MGLFEKLELWRTQKIIGKWAPLLYYSNERWAKLQYNKTFLSSTDFYSAAPYKTYVLPGSK